MATKDLDGLFRWNFASIILPLLLASGLALTLSADYIAAYVVLGASFVWTLLYWYKDKSKQTIVSVIIVIAVIAIGFNRLKQKEFALAALEGLLEPAHDPTPNNACSETRADKDDYILLVGDSQTSLVRLFPHNVITLDGRTPLLWLSRDDQGRIGVNGDFRAPDMKIVVRMRSNRFEINAGEVLHKNRPDMSTLEIEDVYGSEAIKIRYMNSHTIKISGTLNAPGLNSIVIANTLDVGLCQMYNSSDIDIR